MITIRLRAVMDRYEAQTGERLTYERLAERTGLSPATIQSMATRQGYNASLATIERICIALHCTPGDLLHLEDAISGGANER